MCRYGHTQHKQLHKYVLAAASNVGFNTSKWRYFARGARPLAPDELRSKLSILRKAYPTQSGVLTEHRLWIEYEARPRLLGEPSDTLLTRRTLGE